MKINQLFKSFLPEETFDKILNAFGFSSITEERSFCKVDLERTRTVDKLNEMKEEIMKYYLPCKAKLYVINMNVSKCITMFRQILRLYGLSLVSSQRYIKKKKTTFYNIQKKKKQEKVVNHIKIETDKVTISFN